MTTRRVPPDALSVLACPVCCAALQQSDASVACEAGHRFDLHRSGYVNLTCGGARQVAGDSATMVAARQRFLAGGHFDAVIGRVAQAACEAVDRCGGGCIVDSGGGTGEYLAAVLRACPGHPAVLVEASKPAASHVARANPGVAAVVADVWGRLPLADRCAAVVLDIFAPRNAVEFHRVLVDGGKLIVVTPTGGHLRELVEVAAMLTVDPEKDQRLAAALGPLFSLESEQVVSYTIALEREDAIAAVLMGPSSAHITERALGQRLSPTVWPLKVTVSVRIGVYGTL